MPTNLLLLKSQHRSSGLLVTAFLTAFLSAAPVFSAQSSTQGTVSERTESSSGSSSSSNSSSDSGSDQPKSRSLFISLFATHFVPGIAEGLSNWFRGRVFGGDLSSSSESSKAIETSKSNSASKSGDSSKSSEVSRSSEVSKSTETSKSGEPSRTTDSSRPGEPSQAGPPVETKTDLNSRDERNSDSDGEQLHAGVAYQVFVMQSNGQRRSVDPSKRVFNSGEQFEVDYRPNFPGAIEVFNIDPSGKEERIDRVVLEAAQLGKLGPYQFVGAKGKDTLRIVLYPCLGKPPSGDTAQTRGIARVQIRPEIARALQACDDRSQQQSGATRGIAKVSRDGDTAFALDPVSRREIESGKLAPREIRIVFSHQ